MAVVMFSPIGVLCFWVCTVSSDVSGMGGCGVPGRCILRGGVTSCDGTSEVPCVDADSVRGVCVLCCRGGVGARCLLLSASVSAWVAYLYSLTGQWGLEAFWISLASRVTLSLWWRGDFVLCSLCVDGAQVFFDMSIGSVVTCHPSLGRMDLLFVRGVGCPSPGWWVTPERSPSHRGEVLSRGGGGGSACCSETHTGADCAQTACTMVTVAVAGVVGCPFRASQHGLHSLKAICIWCVPEDVPVCLGLRCLRHS